MPEEKFEMKDEYDFTGAEQGKFYRPMKTLKIPFYLEPEVQKGLIEKARKDNTDAAQLINAIVKEAI